MTSEFKEFDVIAFSKADKKTKQKMLEELPILDIQELQKLKGAEK